MPEPVEAIRLLVAPVVMISACGLLCLALYNRLAVIVARARAFNKERVECVHALRADPDAPHLAARVATLDHQFTVLLLRARLVRAALVALLTTVASMLFCSLALGLMTVVTWAGVAALTVFVVGIVTALAAVAFALLELRRALDPVSVEEMSLHEAPARIPSNV